jgi:hypothetical protein
LPGPRKRYRLGMWLCLGMLATAACAPAATPSGGPDGAGDPGLAHVHGLGVDPADGTLYAASHYGVFRLPTDGEPVRIGERRQDTMGFTIVGARHFLGSGHPDPTESNRPPHLGLIESTDAGRTWQTLSLDGEVDFHALEVRHELIYGHDSQTQQLMVSRDGKRWDRRAQLSAADIAVDPRDPDRLLATTEQGLARSTDGGRTFAVVPGAPLALLIDWPDASNLIAIDPNGVVHHSADSGATWTERGRVSGTPTALATRGTSDLYVATGKGIEASRDGGRSFTLRQPLA